MLMYQSPFLRSFCCCWSLTSTHPCFGLPTGDGPGGVPRVMLCRTGDATPGPATSPFIAGPWKCARISVPSSGVDLIAQHRFELSLSNVRNATPVDGLCVGGVSWAPLSCAMNTGSKVSAATGLTQSPAARIENVATMVDVTRSTSRNLADIGHLPLEIAQTG